MLGIEDLVHTYFNRFHQWNIVWDLDFVYYRSVIPMHRVYYVCDVFPQLFFLLIDVNAISWPSQYLANRINYIDECALFFLRPISFPCCFHFLFLFVYIHQEFIQMKWLTTTSLLIWYFLTQKFGVSRIHLILLFWHQIYFVYEVHISIVSCSNGLKCIIYSYKKMNNSISYFIVTTKSIIYLYSRTRLVRTPSGMKN